MESPSTTTLSHTHTQTIHLPILLSVSFRSFEQNWRRFLALFTAHEWVNVFLLLMFSSFFTISSLSLALVLFFNVIEHIRILGQTCPHHMIQDTVRLMCEWVKEIANIATSLSREPVRFLLLFWFFIPSKFHARPKRLYMYFGNYVWAFSWRPLYGHKHISLTITHTHFDVYVCSTAHS